ncbi:MAG TPA: tRNA pseudouridine(55) synthase TruB [Candidatus Hydrogenedentes bacterium]|nr:tRNA pseudouridine(55) synthase TruB [Candidatus Hydrogenedentota bacterium]HOV60250.1 tRNA pseudouridine(55) synthase TruB [Candidatus Hydrogenedentota bacterium]
MDGILAVDKPADITSHDVVDHVRRVAGMRRIGHTGTLDPRATGLLLLCLGKATRLSEFFIGLDKAYEGRMRLGMVSASYDMEGPILEERPVPEGLTLEAIQDACDPFLGEIQQVPPMMSAVKRGGTPLYKMARKGIEVEREPRTVRVDEFRVTAWDPPYARIVVRCSSGTYVRALCHEVGMALGCGAALDTLRRTRVGRFTVDEAVTLDALRAPDDILDRLVPMGKALDLPVVVADNARVAMIENGNPIVTRERLDTAPGGRVQVLDQRGRLIAIGEAYPSAVGYRIMPKRVLTHRAD